MLPTGRGSSSCSWGRPNDGTTGECCAHCRALLCLVLCIVHVQPQGTRVGQPEGGKGQGIGEAPGTGTQREREEWEWVCYAYCSAQCAHIQREMEKDGGTGPEHRGGGGRGAWSHRAGHRESTRKGGVGQGMLCKMFSIVSCLVLRQRGLE